MSKDGWSVSCLNVLLLLWLFVVCWRKRIVNIPRCCRYREALERQDYLLIYYLTQRTLRVRENWTLD